MGLIGYYRKFIKQYGVNAKPLTSLLQKENFGWNKSAQLAFEKLKRALTTTPLLALPNFEKTFEVEIDASGTGFGAILMQEGKPLAYFSKALGPKA